jgi:hypothetical protein
MRVAILGFVAILLAAPAHARAAGSRPVLSLSRSSGAAGTHVVVLGRDCTKPLAQADTLAWHDAYYLLHDGEKKPPMGVWRSIPVMRTSMTTVRGVFIVRKTDHRGRGLLDLFCGNDGQAIATFLVTRH